MLDDASQASMKRVSDLTSCRSWLQVREMDSWNNTNKGYDLHAWRGRTSGTKGNV